MLPHKHQVSHLAVVNQHRNQEAKTLKMIVSYMETQIVPAPEVVGLEVLLHIIIQEEQEEVQVSS